jgi:hypothetical protein
MTAIGIVAVAGSELLTAATFATNYDAQRSWYVGISGRCRVEAQFYVLWASIRVLVGRARIVSGRPRGGRRRPGGARRNSRARAGVALVHRRGVSTVVDALATGSLLAMMHARLAGSSR